MLASGSEDETIKIWDVKTGKLLFSKSNGDCWSAVESVSLSPDGKLLASGGDKTVKIWNIATEELLFSFNDHIEKVVSVSFSPDSRLLASCSRDGTVKLWVRLNNLWVNQPSFSVIKPKSLVQTELYFERSCSSLA